MVIQTITRNTEYVISLFLMMRGFGKTVCLRQKTLELKKFSGSVAKVMNRSGRTDNMVVDHIKPISIKVLLTVQISAWRRGKQTAM